MNPSQNLSDSPTQNKKRRSCRRGCAWGCGTGILILTGASALLMFLGNRVPSAYPPAPRPIPPPSKFSSDLDGFDSPYLGHTGSWDGKGGGMGGSSKISDLEKERSMGLRWTFMPVYWSVMEPNGAVDLSREIPPAWQALDAFVIEAQKRRLNILMQAPVIGGNAGGPPNWAGRREAGKSAPTNMKAAADFAGKLAARYCPGGTLAIRQGWGKKYGVRAWELDNEPESYFTSWQGQAGDYAEFVTKVAARIKEADANAVILAPGMAGGGGHLGWLRQTLQAKPLVGSPTFRKQNVPYSIGPLTDVVSFHIYEGLDTSFSGKNRTIETAFSEIQTVFEQYENTPGFTYQRKQDYWHTEGNFDFLGILSAKRRAAWRFQFFTRAFAAGIRKVIIMDASNSEQDAVRAYIKALPNPFPMLPATKEIKVLKGRAIAFRHPRDKNSHVWIVWAQADTGNALVEIPVQKQQIEIVEVDGKKRRADTRNQRLRLSLKGDVKMPPPLLIID